MMQMLVAGGLAPLTDGQRGADEDNPRGYLEYDKTKSLRSDNSWLGDARGKVVKVIVQLLEYLPREKYRIVFMQRDLIEVVRSQRTMLERSGKQGAALSDAQLEGLFSKQVEAVDRFLQASDAQVLKVQHRSCIDCPAEVAAEVNRFLGGGLDEGAMVEAVDPTLYRQQSGPE
ncbi:sulfotransferase family protein [Posidoniimonas polymericola]|nr:sulfotransferase family protein [Posidoniimonas polymericola]